MATAIVTRKNVWMARCLSLVKGAPVLHGLDACTRLIASRLAVGSSAQSFKTDMGKLEFDHHKACLVLQRRGLLYSDGTVCPEVRLLNLTSNDELLEKYLSFSHDPEGGDQGFAWGEIWAIGSAFLMALSSCIELPKIDFCSQKPGIHSAIPSAIRAALQGKYITQLSIKAGPDLSSERIATSLKYALRYLATNGLPEVKTTIPFLPGIGMFLGSAVSLNSLGDKEWVPAADGADVQRQMHGEINIYRTF